MQPKTGCGVVIEVRRGWWHALHGCMLIGCCPLFLNVKVVLKEKNRAFVAGGENQSSPWDGLKNQIDLGDDAFVDEMKCKMAEDVSFEEVPSSQTRQVAKPLSYYESSVLGIREGIHL